MITIEITNNKGKLIGDIKKLMQIQKAFKVKNPNAYFIRLRAKNVQPNILFKKNPAKSRIFDS